MNAQTIKRLSAAIGAALCGFIGVASTVQGAPQVPHPPPEAWYEVAAEPALPLEPAPVQPPAPQPQNKESTRPPVKPVPAESRTPEEASARAADPKDPSGALIVKPPLRTAPLEPVPAKKSR